MLRRLCLNWGVSPCYAGFVTYTDEMVARVDAMLREEGLVQQGDNLVILAGMPPTQQGTTNLLRLHRVGN